MISTIAVLALAAAADQPRWELKGYALGSSFADFQAAHPEKPGPTFGGVQLKGGGCVKQDWADSEDDARCRVGDQTIAGVGATLYLEFIDGKLRSITAIAWPSASYDTIYGALETKFGAPASSTVEKLQNRMGATFESRTSVWTAPSGDHLDVKERGGKVDEGILNLYDATFMADFDRLRKAKASKAASDL